MKQTARILYLDDQTDWLEQFGAVLTQKGYIVNCVSTQEEAWDLIKRIPFDLAILDVRLDESIEDNVDGAHLAIRIKQDNTDLPVILFTGNFRRMKHELLQSLLQYSIVSCDKGDLETGGHADIMFHIHRLLPKEIRRKSCLVIMPFAKEFDNIYEKGIKACLSEMGVDFLRVDEAVQAGYIPKKIWRYLQASDIIIADLTGNNPNVVYELGYAQTLSKPTVLICQNQSRDDIEFGISGDSTIFYSDKSYADITKLKMDLGKTFEMTLQNQPNTGIPKVKKVQSNTFLAYASQGKIEEDVCKNIILPVTEELNLTPIDVVISGKELQQRDEHRIRNQQAAIVIADISVPDHLGTGDRLPSDMALVYYNIGSCDALRDRGLILLMGHGQLPPFSFKNRVDLIRYSIDIDSAFKAQVELKKRISTILLERKGVASTNSPVSSDMVSKQQKLYDSIQVFYNQAVADLTAHTGEHWTAIKRKQQSDTIGTLKLMIGSWADGFQLLVETSETIEALAQVTQALTIEAPNWGNNAIKELYR